MNPYSNLEKDPQESFAKQIFQKKFHRKHDQLWEIQKG